MEILLNNAYPKISIITPTYNQGDFIEQTIRSIVDQNYPNLEYIIIDGGSTDNTVDIIKKYEDRITYWVSEPDKGMYDAIQKGFDKSTGDIMTWLNSDDMYIGKSLFSVAEIMTTFKEIDWLMGLPVNFDEFGKIVRTRKYKRWSRYEFLMKECYTIQQESVFWSRHLWERSKARIRTDLQYAGDFALWMHFFRYAQLYSTRLTLAGFRFRSENQKTHNQDAYVAEVDQLFEDLKLEHDEKRRIEKIQRLRFYKKHIPFLDRIGRVNAKYFDLADYPSDLTYDRGRGFYLKKFY